MFMKFRPKSEFLKNVLTLITGTTLAQFVSLLAAPVLSRLFTPDDYGVLGTYLSIVTVLSLLSTARYDYVVLLPKHDADAINILGLASSILLIYTGIVATVIVVGVFSEVITPGKLGQWIFVVPFSVFLLSLNQTLSFWHNRKKRYGFIAAKRITQTLSVAVTALTLGLTKVTDGGLLIANIVGTFIGVAVFVVALFMRDSGEISTISTEKMKKLGRLYIRYPKFAMPANVLSGASLELPVLFLSAYAGVFYAGQYSFMRRIVTFPMRLIGGATGEVFRQKAAQLYNDTGSCLSLYLATLKKLLLLAVPSFFLLFTVGPMLFTLVFGEAWAEAGRYVRMLVPLFFFQLIDSPISSISLLTGHERYSFFWQLSKLLVTVLSFAGGLIVLNSVHAAIIAFSASLSFLYALDLIFAYYFSKGTVAHE